MQKIIGRAYETAELQRLYDSGKPELVVMYGRRRVGKTFLIREFFDGRFAFYHTGLSQQEIGLSNQKDSQLQNFASSLRRFGMTKQGIPSDWLTAFDDLQALLEEKIQSIPGQRQVVFIDELPWMDTPKGNLIGALENFWNGWATARQEKDIVLIVCGSATSWISKKLLKDKGGLRGRLTLRVKLVPFTLRECELFARGANLALGRKDVLELYLLQANSRMEAHSLPCWRNWKRVVSSAASLPPILPRQAHPSSCHGNNKRCCSQQLL